MKMCDFYTYSAIYQENKSNFFSLIKKISPFARITFLQIAFNFSHSFHYYGFLQKTWHILCHSKLLFKYKDNFLNKRFRFYFSYFEIISWFLQIFEVKGSLTLSRLKSFICNNIETLSLVPLNIRIRTIHSLVEPLQSIVISGALFNNYFIKNRIVYFQISNCNIKFIFTFIYLEI